MRWKGKWMILNPYSLSLFYPTVSLLLILQETFIMLFVERSKYTFYCRLYLSLALSSFSLFCYFIYFFFLLCSPSIAYMVDDLCLNERSGVTSIRKVAEVRRKVHFVIHGKNNTLLEKGHWEYKYFEKTFLCFMLVQLIICRFYSRIQKTSFRRRNKSMQARQAREDEMNIWWAAPCSETRSVALAPRLKMKTVTRTLMSWPVLACWRVWCRE